MLRFVVSRSNYKGGGDRKLVNALRDLKNIQKEVDYILQLSHEIIDHS